MIEIAPNEDEENILQKVKYWLKSKEERATRAALGRRIACSKYTYEEEVQQMIEVWNLYREGRRGALFPHPFSVSGQLA